jgi:hypothetical protein
MAISLRIRAVPLAGLALERPGPVLAPAPEIDDGAHALTGKAGEILRGGLG